MTQQTNRANRSNDAPFFLCLGIRRIRCGIATANQKVTHPEVTTEHVFGAASSLVFALAAFLVHAAADLTIDACGAVIPSLCGTREARLAAAYSRLQAGGAGGGGGGDGAGDVRRIGQEGGRRVIEQGTDGAPGEGHELDQYFVV